MSKIAVLDTHKRILEPCHPAVARRLLREGQAAVYKRYPFTIILKREVTDPTTTDYTLSIDPGSKCTGLAITDAENNITAVFELHHRGSAIKRSLSARAGYRRSRRARKLRYRPPRWQNRSRKAPVRTETGWVYQSFGQSSKGWIPSSLMSRVFNIDTWVNRLSKAYPITRNSLSNTSNSIPNSWRILKSLALRISTAHFTRRSFGNIYLKSLIANASTAAQKMYPLKKSIFFREPKAERIEPITSPFRAVRVILKRETDIPTRWTDNSASVSSRHFASRKNR